MTATESTGSLSPGGPEIGNLPWPPRRCRREQDDAWLERVFALEPRVWMRRVPGRETFPWRAGAEREAVVKRYRGGERGDVGYELLRGLRPRTPARREGENLDRLRTEGFPVPRVFAWFEDRAVLGRSDGRRSCVLMEHLRLSGTLRERLAGLPEDQRRAWLALLVGLVARMHEHGWYHRDLYLQHLVIPEGAGKPELLLLDVGRARWERQPRERWFVKDLAALLHSAPEDVGARERLRFLAMYLDLRRIDSRADRRRLCAAVVRKARRIAAHRPRHGETDAENGRI